jgi:alpha 1,3-glucosidase
MQAGAYQPFFRGHAHHDSKRREPWVFGEEWMFRMRHATMARYALLPFWYTVFYEASTTGMPVMRPMWMQYPKQEDLGDLDDQWLIGSDLLVKPVTQAGKTSVEVQLPSNDIWYDVDNLKPMPKSPSILTVKATLDKTPAYQRGGSIIPRKLRLRRSSELMKHDPYTLYVALDNGGNASGTLYMDDELSFDHHQDQYGIASFSLTNKNGGTTLSNSIHVPHLWKDALPENYQIERIIVMGMHSDPNQVVLTQVEEENIKRETLTYSYNSEAKVMIVRKPPVSALNNWVITIG